MTIAITLIACASGEVLFARLRTNTAVASHPRTTFAERLISCVLAVACRLANAHTTTTLIHILPRWTQMATVSWWSGIVRIGLIELIQD